MIIGTLITVVVIYGGIFLILLACFVHTFLNWRAITSTKREMSQNASEVLGNAGTDQIHDNAEVAKDGDDSISKTKSVVGDK